MSVISALSKAEQPFINGLFRIPYRSYEHWRRRPLWTSKKGCYGRKHQKIHKIISQDRKMRLIKITDKWKIQKQRFGHIFYDNLDIRKFCVKVGAARAHNRRIHCVTSQWKRWQSCENCFRIHHILRTCSPATFSCSHTSREW